MHLFAAIATPPVRDRLRVERSAAQPVGRPQRVATVITRLSAGAGLLALRGASAMNPEEFELTIVAGSGDRLLDAAQETGMEVIVEPSLCAPIAPHSDLRALWRLRALFGDRDFDVVHTHCAKAGVLGRLAALQTGVPRIVHTYHGFPFHEFQSKARRSTYVAIERQLGRFTDAALCVGSGVASEAVRRRLVAPERIRTIGVAVDGVDTTAASMSAREPSARRRARIALGLPLDATVVGAVGRLTYQKAPEDFLSAMKALGRPDVVGVWVGGGELAERMRHLAQSIPDVRIVLAGERSDVLDVLPAFDVFALTSRYEGLPTAVVEAMVCGVPVVATAVNAVSDLVAPGETGLLVPPCRPELMAAALRYMLDSPTEASRMATTAHARLGDRFGEPALRSALAAAYVPVREGWAADVAMSLP